MLHSESFYRSVFEHSMEAVFLTAPDGAIFAANPAACKLFGRTEEEICKIGRPGLVDATSPQLASFIEERARTGRARAELIFIRGDGSRFPGEVSSEKFIGVSGQERTILVVRDITERKQAEQKLIESEDQYRLLIAAMAEGVTLQDENSAIIAFNKSAERILGLSADQLSGRTSFDPRWYPIHEDGSPFPGETHPVVQTLKTGVPQSDVIMGIHKPDGELTWISINVQPIFKEGKTTPYRVVATMHDITEQRRAQARILKLSRLYDTLSQINTAIVHSTNQQDLFRNICKAVVEHGKFLLAWVGLVDEATHRVNPVFHYGDEQGYLTNIDISTDDIPEGRGPTGTSIRENRVCYINNFRTDERTKPWSEAATKRGFLSSVGLPFRLKGKVIGALTVYSRELEFFDAEQLALMNEMSADISFALDNFSHEAERKRAEQQIAEYVQQLEGTMQNTLQAVANMVEMRDPYTAGHERRVGLVAAAIAREMGWPEDKCHNLQLIGLVHDIGKIAVPAEILTKPGRLTKVEYQIVQAHSEKGYEILKDVDFPLPIAEIIYQHHERMDGSGYPRGLKNGEILPEARILAVADVLESMASHRPYRPALGIEAALKEIEDHRGTWFDAPVVDAMLKLIREKGYQLPA